MADKRTRSIMALAIAAGILYGFGLGTIVAVAMPYLERTVSFSAVQLSSLVAAAKAYGIESYDIWDVPDCEIEPTVEFRKRMTRMVREFAPHVIITHRMCDYHADHRACSQLVQDMTYMLRLPNWCPEAPVPSVRPAVFFMTDDFVLLAKRWKDGFLRKVEGILEERMGLTVNREKTKVLDLDAERSSLVFLGYEFRCV